MKTKPGHMNWDQWEIYLKNNEAGMSVDLGNHVYDPDVIKWQPMPLPSDPLEKPLLFYDYKYAHQEDDADDYDADDSPEYYPEGEYVERTLVMLKPDSYERNLMGEIINILDSKELKLIGAKQLTMDVNTVKKHYKNHVGKGFFPDLVDFMTSGPCFALVYEGNKACAVVRQLIGEKHPGQSPAGSIRGKYASEYPRNLIHGSDNMDEAEAEIKLYFDESELFGSYFKKNQKKLEAEVEAKKKAAKDAILAKPLVPGMPISYPEQLVTGMTITGKSGGQAYRILSTKKKPKGAFELVFCGTQYVDDPYQKEQYKVTLTYDDISFQTDNWQLLKLN